MKLTRAQVEVLTMLAESPRGTTRTTHHSAISGACASGLIRRGLAKGVADDRPLGGGWHVVTGYYVKITEAGRRALKEHR